MVGGQQIAQEQIFSLWADWTDRLALDERQSRIMCLLFRTILVPCVMGVYRPQAGWMLNTARGLSMGCFFGLAYGM